MLQNDICPQNSPEWGRVSPPGPRTNYFKRSISIVALATIVFFGEEYDASPLVSAGAVLLSGKIPDIILKGLTKRETFKGWEKIHKEDAIRNGVDSWKNERAISAATENVATALVWKTTSNEILV